MTTLKDQLQKLKTKNRPATGDAWGREVERILDGIIDVIGGLSADVLESRPVDGGAEKTMTRPGGAAAREDAAPVAAGSALIPRGESPFQTPPHLIPEGATEFESDGMRALRFVDIYGHQRESRILSAKEYALRYAYDSWDNACVSSRMDPGDCDFLTHPWLRHHMELYPYTEEADTQETEPGDAAPERPDWMTRDPLDHLFEWAKDYEDDEGFFDSPPMLFAKEWQSERARNAKRVEELREASDRLVSLNNVIEELGAWASEKAEDDGDYEGCVRHMAARIAELESKLAEKERAPDADPDTVFEELKGGGPWLAAARKWSYRYAGDSLKWDSREEVRIPFVELWDLAQTVAEEAIREERRSRARETLKRKDRWALEQKVERLESQLEEAGKREEERRSGGKNYLSEIVSALEIKGSAHIDTGQFLDGVLGLISERDTLRRERDEARENVTRAKTVLEEVRANEARLESQLAEVTRRFEGMRKAAYDGANVDGGIGVRGMRAILERFPLPALWAPKEVWGHASHKEAEHWSGAFETRDECLQDAYDTYTEGDVFWVTRGEYPDPAKFVPDAAQVTEQMSECDGEPWTEDPWNFGDGHAEALELALSTWARRYVDNASWRCVGEPERATVPPLHITEPTEPNGEES